MAKAPTQQPSVKALPSSSSPMTICSQLRRHLRHELGRSGQDGLLVLDASSGLQGILLDFWQRPISGPKTGGRSFLGDVGFFGPDGRQEWQVPAFATWVRGARA